MAVARHQAARGILPGRMTRARLSRLAAIGLLAGACQRAPAPGLGEAPPVGPAVHADAPRRDARAAIGRAGAWMAGFPEEELRYDAAIALAAIRARIDDPAIEAALVRARRVADQDDDNPMRRLLEPASRVARGVTTGWSPPGAGERRANVNRVVAEALHCDEHGLRPETIAYATGPMRDDGGYHTAHAVWALALARDRGCLAPAELAPRWRPLLDELRAAQPAAPEPTALAVDLFAERLLVLLLAGERDPALDGWAARLLEAQHADGAFGAPAPVAEPYHRYHATMVAAWALTEWLAAGGGG
jgi:hypothetical protein